MSYDLDFKALFVSYCIALHYYMSSPESVYVHITTIEATVGLSAIYCQV